jgi:hypothetical protein
MLSPKLFALCLAANLLLNQARAGAILANVQDSIETFQDAWQSLEMSLSVTSRIEGFLKEDEWQDLLVLFFRVE